MFKYLFFGLLFPLQGNGLESDQRQPIRIQADKAVITDKEGLSVYEGDVIGAESVKKAWEKGAKLVLLPTVPFGVYTGQMI